jgi:DNA-binding transcriptional MerR regulator
MLEELARLTLRALQMVMTIGQLGRRYGLPDWRIRRLITHGKLPEPPRLGNFRVFTEDDIPAVEAALRDAGLLPAQAIGA